MRTTLTLDPDVAHALERLRRERRLSFKEAVNQTLRNALQRPRKKRAKSRPFQTRSVDHGRPLIGQLDDIAGVLAILEGEGFK